MRTSNSAARRWGLHRVRDDLCRGSRSRASLCRRWMGRAPCAEVSSPRALPSRRRCGVNGRTLTVYGSSCGGESARCLSEIGMEHLDGHDAIVLEIRREKHGGHAARADLPLDAVPRSQSARESREAVCHGSIIVQRRTRTVRRRAGQRRLRRCISADRNSEAAAASSLEGLRLRVPGLEINGTVAEHQRTIEVQPN